MRSVLTESSLLKGKGSRDKARRDQTKGDGGRAAVLTGGAFEVRLKCVSGALDVRLSCVGGAFECV